MSLLYWSDFWGSLHSKASVIGDAVGKFIDDMLL